LMVPLFRNFLYYNTGKDANKDAFLGKN